jgi:hypothetical protein
MNSPRSVRPNKDIRLSPADGEALSKQKYELRASDGALVCLVSRRHAESGIRAGSLTLWKGKSGAYLRATPIAVPPLPALPKGAVKAPPSSSQRGTLKKWPGRRHPVSGHVGSVRASWFGSGV